VDPKRTALEVHTLVGGGQLQGDGLEGDGIILIEHYAFVFGRQRHRTTELEASTVDSVTPGQ
jgi:hypothetical protein